MKILVLDTIHGGKTLAEYLKRAGHVVDTVDVYRGRDGSVSEDEAAGKVYDLIAAPVHLDPDYRLLNTGTDVISHHEAVTVAASVPEDTLLIEITGARGKTTTAHALLHLMEKDGCGILHTSKGTVRYPEKDLIFKRSITPATLVEVLSAAAGEKECRWIIAEESVGVTGLGDLGVLTSGTDYPIANGKKSALDEKIRLLKGCKKILLAPGVDADIPGAYYSDDIVIVEDDVCRFGYAGIKGEFSNKLLTVEGYKEALMTAAAAGCILGKDPSGLGSFSALEGRLSYSTRDGKGIIDNSNSGANRKTALTASAYAHRFSPGREQVLVIGIEAENICEGFPDDEIAGAISDIMPYAAVVVSKDPENVRKIIPPGIKFETASSLEDGAEKAMKYGTNRIIILSVKTWR
ncbi:coenzyme F430 synthase [Methanolacinia petrolearia]|uniref:coenzyme F430 synthase n=1 Tax=Methanolacinia petrolearia TaxID=54120 RepID=UPI003BAA5964